MTLAGASAPALDAAETIAIATRVAIRRVAATGNTLLVGIAACMVIAAGFILVAAVSAAALTIYDMCKAVDRTIRITDIRLAHKRGGRSGDLILEE